MIQLTKHNASYKADRPPELMRGKPKRERRRLRQNKKLHPIPAERLIYSLSAQGFPFMILAGDIHDGSTVCVTAGVDGLELSA